MRELDWKSGPLPAEGWYLAKRSGDDDYKAAPAHLGARPLHDSWVWIGPLPERAPDPPAPTWGRGPVPADGLYVVELRADDHELRWYEHLGGPDDDIDWYGPIPALPEPAEDPAEANEWADLAREERCRLAALERRVEDQNQDLSRLHSKLSRIRSAWGACRLPEELHPLRDEIYEALS